MEGKKVKRLDKTINAVLKLTRDNFFQRLIKLAKNAPTEKIKKIRQSHSASEAIKFEQIQILKDETGTLYHHYQIQMYNITLLKLVKHVNHA